jgi:hypothetical protein
MISQITKLKFNDLDKPFKINGERGLEKYEHR